MDRRIFDHKNYKSDICECTNIDTIDNNDRICLPRNEEVIFKDEKKYCFNAPVREHSDISIFSVSHNYDELSLVADNEDCFRKRHFHQDG